MSRLRVAVFGAGHLGRIHTRLLRTQDLPPLYEENSNLYLFTRTSFAATGARIGAKPAIFVTPRLESWDIDDEEGFMVAELVAARTRLG